MFGEIKNLTETENLVATSTEGYMALLKIWYLRIRGFETLSLFRPQVTSL